MKKANPKEVGFLFWWATEELEWQGGLRFVPTTKLNLRTIPNHLALDCVQPF